MLERTPDKRQSPRNFPLTQKRVRRIQLLISCVVFINSNQDIKIEFVEESRPGSAFSKSGLGTPRWAIYCQVKFERKGPLNFPAVGFGAEEDGQAPSFVRKKVCHFRYRSPRHPTPSRRAHVFTRRFVATEHDQLTFCLKTLRMPNSLLPNVLSSISFPLEE
jgi:hypothetical protein